MSDVMFYLCVAGIIYAIALLVNIRRKAGSDNFDFDNVVSFGLNEKFKAAKIEKQKEEKSSKLKPKERLAATLDELGMDDDDLM